MKVDRDQFMDQGYLIFRNLIPSDRLESMRASCETMLERQKVNWARERGPDDPPGGEYEKVRQPRVMMKASGSHRRRDGQCRGKILGSLTRPWK